MVDNACYGCTERFVGCHANCEKYIAWNEERQKTLAEARERNRKKDAIEGYYAAKKQRVNRYLKSLRQRNPVGK